VPYSGIAIGPGCVPAVYCTSKPNSVGCLPSISGFGYPSTSAPRGFTISAKNVRNNKVGLLLYGTNGRLALPFLGGTLCVAQPFKRGPSTSSGGSHWPAIDCSGTWSMDFNTFLRPSAETYGAPTPPNFLPGTVVNCQWWGRDGPLDAALTDALEFELCP